MTANVCIFKQGVIRKIIISFSSHRTAYMMEEREKKNRKCRGLGILHKQKKTSIKVLILIKLPVSCTTLQPDYLQLKNTKKCQFEECEQCAELHALKACLKLIDHRML